jgi:hypothetical protein
MLIAAPALADQAGTHLETRASGSAWDPIPVTPWWSKLFARFGKEKPR